jgi:hypothetical protein
MNLIDNVPICGTSIQAVGPLAKWPGSSPDIPYFVDTAGYAGSFSQEKILEIFRLAWKEWATALVINPIEVRNPQEAFVRIHFARIDGSSGVLAWSELADNTNRPKTQRYDSGEQWSADRSNNPPGIDLIRVATHEIGHVLGLDHDSPSAEAIMRPMYSTRLPVPTERDMQRMVGLGYAKRTAPQPPPPGETPDPPPIGPTPPGSAGKVMVDLDRKVIQVPVGWTTTYTTSKVK